MKKTIWVVLGICSFLLLVAAQQPDVKIELTKGERPRMAAPDFRGSGGAAPLMETFNGTLFSELESSGLFEMVSKSMMPTQVPQQPSDIQIPPPAQPAPVRRGAKSPPPPPRTGNGLWLQDWASPPASANYMAMGYTADQNGILVLQGWLLNVRLESAAAAQVFGKRYFGNVDQEGARKVAREFAADIIQQFGGKSLLNTRIYFVSDRTGNKEIWSMDPDGSNQRQLTKLSSLSIHPAVSPEGDKIAFTSYVRGNPGIFVFTSEGRQLPFYNQRASMNATPDFTPDGRQIVYSSTAAGNDAQIYIANVNGTDFRRVSAVRTIEVEPKVNPKTGRDIVFVSGRSGPQQIYRMSIDGTGVQRLTPGEGEASNPAWHPDGQIIAYSWTRGFATGNFNIFMMDVATRSFTQLTHSQGRNENPTWAPNGAHLVFASTRSGRSQIWTMLANGTQVRQLTTQGSNFSPVWGRSGL
jgi:TolB protein